MHRLITRTVATALAGSLFMVSATPGMAQVARPQSAQASAAGDNPVEQVRWRGRGVGIGLGLAAGALLGGAIASSRYGYGYYDPYYAPAPVYVDPPVYAAPPPAVYGGGDAYCAQRFRSYDPASGTYLGYDGLRHPCP